jgi:predicted RNA binding protein YcfA (HicA-like mRNA interferase family)
MKRIDLERHLRNRVVPRYREGGGHAVWLNPSKRKVASIPRHREIKEGTVRAICKQLEIPQP